MRSAASILALVALCVPATAAAQGEESARGGTIRVLSNAEKATVSLDGHDVGLAPIEIRQVKPGEHVVAVRAEGRGRREDRVTVEPGATAVVTLDLDAAPGGEAAEGAGEEQPPDEEDVGGEPAGGPPGAAAEPAGEGPSGAVESGAQPTEEDLLLERRGLSSFGARALPRGRSTVAFGAGYPYIFDSRVTVGTMERGGPFALDAGVLFRTYGARWELGVTSRLTLLEAQPIALGAFADAGGGSTYFDDSKRNYFFASGGVAASLIGLGAVTITGRAYLNAWSDRHCPGEAGEGDPTDVCQGYRNDTLDDEERLRVDQLVGADDIFGRDSGVRAVLSLVVELAMSEKWSGWVLIEGAPRQDERAAYTDLFHSSMFEEDARSYLRAGFVYKF